MEMFDCVHENNMATQKGRVKFPIGAKKYKKHDKKLFFFLAWPDEMKYRCMKTAQSLRHRGFSRVDMNLLPLTHMLILREHKGATVNANTLP